MFHDDDTENEAISTRDASKNPSSGLQQFPCSNCGGALLFHPGSSHLKCPYCGTENEIHFDDQDDSHLKEHDLLAELEKETHQREIASEKPDAQAVQCSNCGASILIAKDRAADSCPYCASPLVIQEAFSCKLNIQAVLPFVVNTETAQSIYRKWLGSLWFAPNDFSRRATREEALKGIYMPFWTYDAHTRTQYQGQRGDHYYVTVTRMANENGKMVPKQYTERRTKWSYVSGTVRVNFDDILVPASQSLPTDLQNSLAPWQLQNTKPFREEFLSGFVTETAQISLKDGFTVAKGRMEYGIQRAIRADIGGDEQRITHADSHYSNLTFKHILLPLWMSAYRYNGKTYQFMINAQTGQLAGQRPWSIIKIAAAVLAVAGILGGLAYYAQVLG